MTLGRDVVTAVLYDLWHTVRMHKKAVIKNSLVLNILNNL